MNAYDPFPKHDVYDSKEFLSNAPEELLPKQENEDLAEKPSGQEHKEVETEMEEEEKLSDHAADENLLKPLMFVNVENVLDKQFTQDQELKVFDSLSFLFIFIYKNFLLIPFMFFF